MLDMNVHVHHGSHSLLDQGVPVGSQEVPGQLVATGVPADGADHIREVLQLHHLVPKALLHHPSDGGTGRRLVSDKKANWDLHAAPTRRACPAGG